MNAPAPSVSLGFAALNFDCVDPAALADFWGKVLGRPASPGKAPGGFVVARPLEEIKVPGARYTTFADPEGNAFDLLTWLSE
ncbi:MAG TPA: VOC family protein [Amycolatopsis sp.]|jgi:hypothetical protein